MHDDTDGNSHLLERSIALAESRNAADCEAVLDELIAHTRLALAYRTRTEIDVAPLRGILGTLEFAEPMPADVTDMADVCDLPSGAIPPDVVHGAIDWPGLQQQVALNEAARLPLYWGLLNSKPFLAPLFWWDVTPGMERAEPRVYREVAVLIAPEHQHTRELVRAAGVNTVRRLSEHNAAIGVWRF